MNFRTFYPSAFLSLLTLLYFGLPQGVAAQSTYQEKQISRLSKRIYKLEERALNKGSERFERRLSRLRAKLVSYNVANELSLFSSGADSNISFFLLDDKGLPLFRLKSGANEIDTSRDYNVAAVLESKKKQRVRAAQVSLVTNGGEEITRKSKRVRGQAITILEEGLTALPKSGKLGATFYSSRRKVSAEANLDFSLLPLNLTLSSDFIDQLEENTQTPLKKDPDQVEFKSFTLVDSDLNRDIRTLLVSDSLVLNELPPVSIRANFSDPSNNIKRVNFYLNEIEVQSERAAPYVLGGDQNGDYYPYNFLAGRYRFTVVAFLNDGSFTKPYVTYLRVRDGNEEPEPTQTSTPTPSPSFSPSPTPSASPTATPSPSPSPSPTPGGDLWADYNFTDLTPSSGARVIYVDSQSGNDSNNGLSPAQAMRTIREAVLKFESGGGRPNQLRLKRGGTYATDGIEGRYDYHWLQGPSLSDPAVLADYGDPSETAPVLKPREGSDMVISVTGRKTITNAVIANLKFRPHEKFEGVAINVNQPDFDNIILENLDIQWFKDGVVLQTRESGEFIENISIRRSIIARVGNGSAYDGANQGVAHPKRAQGIYVNWSKNFKLEDSILAFNGWTSWDPDIFAEAQAQNGEWTSDPRSNASIYSHNIYMQYGNEEPSTFRNNIILEGASHGIQARHGGVLEGNVFARNPINILVGSIEATRDLNDKHVTGTVTNNLIIEAIDINRQLPRGWCLQVQDGEEFLVSDNICANNLGNQAYGMNIRRTSQYSDPEMRTTIIGNSIIDVPHAFEVGERYEGTRDNLNPDKNSFTLNRVRTSRRDRPSCQFSGSDPNELFTSGTCSSLPPGARAFDNVSANETIPALESIYPEFYSRILEQPFAFRAREIRNDFGM
jgi:hypothetical protein